MDKSSVIVAVAFSAADFEPLSELLAALPAACAAALIVVQRLDSSRERLLFETLSQRTIRPVMRPHDGVVAEQGNVYVTAANMALTMTGGRIRVTPNAGGLHHPGDILFTSLAQQRGHDAIGVVLSGEGSDGALGIRAIRQSGGVALAQHPGSARFPSMPIKAIETGCVAFVLRPHEIAQELARLSDVPSATSLAIFSGRKGAFSLFAASGRTFQSAAHDDLLSSLSQHDSECP
ncbi:MAG TPA: chemotaxis protein CheB [Steroidobacteraceae bacterium]|jgi:two-component system CheB/CheR fusion protein|nr:chemotaxis protein CheB [Steroidobacteraceae bacterium]